LERRCAIAGVVVKVGLIADLEELQPLANLGGNVRGFFSGSLG
jgi:hypothetical protein